MELFFRIELIPTGDMGETAQELEVNFEKLFTFAHRWGCVLQIDEADVFLAKRDPADMRRNAIVSGKALHVILSQARWLACNY
jgi:SpoVK/Ycf46/Vps4 family AAA+-type ATPase